MDGCLVFMHKINSSAAHPFLFPNPTISLWIIIKLAFWLIRMTASQHLLLSLKRISMLIQTVITCSLFWLTSHHHQCGMFVCATLTEVIVSADATISASPALMMCSSRSFSMGSMPLGTLSMRENIRCNSVVKAKASSLLFRKTMTQSYGAVNSKEVGRP